MANLFTTLVLNIFHTQKLPFKALWYVTKNIFVYYTE